MTQPTADTVFAIIPAFQGDPALVGDNLRTLGDLLRGVVIVDNSTDTDPEKWRPLQASPVPAQIIMNGCNAGIAAALNQGVATAVAAGAEFVLLLDEDSRPDPSMLRHLLDAWKKQKVAGQLVAAVGPNFSDPSVTGGAIFVRYGRFRTRKRRCRGPDDVVQSGTLMSSGSLIHKSALAAVGLFRDGLFIDYVDTEWCFRARSRGWVCFGVCAAEMRHRFGAGTLPMLPKLGLQIPLRPPQRFYYIFRNALLLFRVGHCPLGWKLYEVRRLVLLFGAYLLFSPQRIVFLQRVCAGIGDGLRGLEGPGPRSMQPGA